MKTSVVLAIVILLCIGVVFPQHRLMIETGAAANAAMPGAGQTFSEFDGRGALSLGVLYQKSLNGSWFAGTGLKYSGNCYKASDYFFGVPVAGESFTINYFVLPFFGGAQFGKWFYAMAAMNIELDAGIKAFRLWENHSGLGFGASAGVHLDKAPFFFLLGPSFQGHTLVPFKKGINYHRQKEFGFNFGVGYFL